MSRTTRPIPDEIARHLDEIVRLCKQFHVIELDLFGSATTGDFDPEKSDFDFLVEFDYLNPDYRALRDLLGFKESLQALLGRPVDLTSGTAVHNPYLKRSIDEQRVHVFAA